MQQFWRNLTYKQKLWYGGGSIGSVLFVGKAILFVYIVDEIDRIRKSDDERARAPTQYAMPNDAQIKRLQAMKPLTVKEKTLLRKLNKEEYQNSVPIPQEEVEKMMESIGKKI